MAEQIYHFPLAGSYNTRVAATNSLTAPSSGIVGVGKVGVMVVGQTNTVSTKDQRFVNCFAERVQNPYTGKLTIYLVKRPGFASILTPAAGSIGTAIMVWTGSSSKVISAFGGTNSTIYNSTTSLGAITGKANGITETRVGADVATIAITSTDNTAWYYDVATGTATKIADADYPGNAGETIVGTFAHMDGFAFIMDAKGRIWNSDVNSLTAWTAAQFVTANSYPDAGIGVVRAGDKIMAFGTESVQFYSNSGLTPLLARIEPMTLRVGCVSADAITGISGTVFWAGSSAQGGIGIYAGVQGAHVSTPEIDAILIIAGAGGITLSATKFYGRSFVIVTASTLTFVYCVEEKAWHEWSSVTPLWYKCAGLSSGTSQVTYSVSNISTSGKVFTINPASHTYQDNGVAFTAMVQTSSIGDNSAKTFWHSMQIDGDVEDSTSQVTVQCYDDDFKTATLLGVVDMSQTTPTLTRLGAAYRRSYVFSNPSNTPWRVSGISGRLSKGTPR